ncbi:hypothetical protein LINGRAPRIM_LOCUS2036 [Linum grandiflorum]
MIVTFFLVIIITSHLILLSPISQVNADPVLIARTCDRSQHSDYCDACFDSMKGLTSHQDLRGLGGSSIYCAFRQFMAAHEKLESCYSTKDGEVRMKCRTCIDQFDSAIEHVMEGMKMWRESRYVVSKAQLELASDQVFDCTYSWSEFATSDMDVKLAIGQVVHSDGYIYAACGTMRQLLPDYDPNSR